MGYFEEGNHIVREESFVQKPYLGSEVYGWRHFVNFYGPPEFYGPLGVPNIVYHTLNVY
ncbi:MAG: hypothetical protein ACFFCC_15245 [Promethearchaeota archaeon]